MTYTLHNFFGDDFLDRTPPQYGGGVIANTLGFNILKTIFMSVWRMKPKKVRKEIQEFVDVLDRDGILVIPNFFPTNQFEAIKREFDEIYAGWSPFDYKPEELTKRQKDFPEYFETIAEKITSPTTPAYTNFFVNNELIREITSAVVHRKSQITPDHHFWYLQRRSLEKDNVGSLHNASAPHADVSYPTIKVFLYLNDVDETNAAYTYAKGSHKLSLKRLLFEYKLSVRYAKNKNDLEVSNEEVAKIGYDPQPVCGKANTLIISNNMGYHSRGDFKTLEPRLTAQLCFRRMESWRNILARNDKKIFSKISSKLVKTFDKVRKEKKRASFSNNNMS